MSKTLTKEELVRAAWLVELRRQGHRQCNGEFKNGMRVCALGLLAEVAHYDLDGDEDADIVGALAGLTTHQAKEIAARNDGGLIGVAGVVPKGIRRFREHTFAEIADVIEGWFKKP